MADQWFLGAIAGSRELGLYSVTVAWVEALFYPPGVLVLIQRPDLVRAEREEAVRDASRMFRVAVILATIMFVGLIVLAPVLCVTVFGDEFGGAVEMLRILVFAAPGIVAYELLSSALIAQRKPLHAGVAVAAAFLLTVILNPLLIPTGGGMGAAVARSLAYGLGGAAVALIFTRVLRGRLGDLAPRGNELSWFVGKVKGRFSGG